MPHLDRDGVRLRYDVSGSGPTVVLTHGFGATSAVFDATRAALAADHTVVTWDLRGHGDSDSPPDPAAYSTALAIADLAALLDATGAERAVVAGHSLGGYLSLAFRLAHPERVDALVLIGTGPGYRQEEARARWNDMALKYAAGLAAGRTDPMGDDDDDLDLSAHRDPAGLALAGRGILTQHDATVIDSLPSIDVPTLVTVGDHDRAFVAGSRYMAERIPGAELVVIPGTGHSPHVSRADEVGRVLRSFLASTRAAHR
jgi:pimeloyl-ACP methyl ester carboxylesterase